MTSGIYQIRNVKNGMSYVGSSNYIPARIGMHKFELRNNNHPNKILQNDWNIFGEERFVFEIVKEIKFKNKTHKLNEENKYILVYPNGYNLVDAFGGSLSEITKNKKRKIMIGNNLGSLNKGRSGRSPSKNEIEKTRSRMMGNSIPQGIKTKQNTSSKYVGVTFIKSTKKWQSRISYNKKRIHIGYFDNEFDAVIAYNNKAVELYGEDAKTNNIKHLT